MVTITRLSQPRDVRNTRRALSSGQRVSASDLSSGGAVSQTGDAIAAVASRIHDANVSNEITKSQIELRDRLDQERRNIANDTQGDPAGFESRFEIRSKEIIEEVGGNIKGAKYRNAWRQHADKSALDHTLQLRSAVRQRQVESSRAEALRLASGFSEIANDPSKSREQLEADYATNLQNIKRQSEAGMLNAEQQAAAEIKLSATLKAGVSLRHAKEVENRLDNGDTALAEEYFKVNYAEMTPQSREALEGVIESKGRAQKEVNTADDLLAQAGGDYGEALTAARSIKDADMRLAVEDRIAKMQNQNDAATKIEQGEIRDEMLDMVVDGAGWAEIPAELMGRADGATRRYIQDEIRQNASYAQRMRTSKAEERAALAEMSAISKNHIEGMAALDMQAFIAGPETWAESSPSMAAAWGNLSPTHRSELHEKRRKKIAAGGTVDAQDKVYKQMVEMLPRFGVPDNATTKKTGSFLGLGGSSGVTKFNNAEFDSKPDEATSFEAAVQSELWIKSAEWTAQNADALPKSDDMKRMYAEAFRSVDPDRFPLYDSGAYAAGIANAADPMVSTAWQMAYDKLGRNPTPAEIEQTRQMLLGASAN